LHDHSITSSAWASKIDGISIPSAFAVSRFNEKPECCGLLDREFGGVRAFENLVNDIVPSNESSHQVYGGSQLEGSMR
jgi:hypothetical protein